MDVVHDPGFSHVRTCRRLRWKGMFHGAEPDPTLPDMGDGFVWCTHNMNCLGPDGKAADRDTCVPGRRCYEKWG